MIDGPFRRFLPKMTGPLVRLYSFFGLSPNAISVGSLLMACVASYFCARGEAYFAIIFWWFGRLFDGTDGIYARAISQTSDFGAYLDIVCDMASYSVMILGFALLHPQLQFMWSIILVLYVLCITSALALGSLEQKLGISLRDNRGLRLGAGLAEGGETGIAYTLFLLFPHVIVTTGYLWIGILGLTVLARTILARRIVSTRAN